MINHQKESDNLTSLSNFLFTEIRENILQGKYATGEKITESKICKKYEVSRTPVREAFKQLELEGLIENIPNRGAFVLGFSKQDIQDIYELRRAVEVIAIKWSIERISPSELEELQEAYDLMEFYTIKKDVAHMLQINTRFHEIIYNSTHSRFLEQVLRSYQFYIRKTRKAALQMEDLMSEVLKEHKKILDAIYQKDISAGETAVTEHLINSQERAEMGLKIQNDK